MKKIILISAVLSAAVFCILFSNNTTTPQNNDKRIFTVIIDAGHGGKDPGTTGLSGVYEKNIVLP
ncbi:MAG: N-acetylmuramoyl-L-alanine amidase, partial [Bacteroidetes bacterium]|nr:N-acetylmuramoyl-L-alanine amidase [Bacteroidota bacterium]